MVCNSSRLVRSTGKGVGNVVKADNAQGVESSVDELRLSGAGRGSEKGAVNASRAGDAANIAGLAVRSQVRATDGQGRGGPDQAVVQVHVDAGCKNDDGIRDRAHAVGDGAIAGARNGGCGGRTEDGRRSNERRVKKSEECKGLVEHREGMWRGKKSRMTLLNDLRSARFYTERD
ncbi:hypothetical protein C8F04DRAFT_1101856 [Mycena alexandri]|uniref:Uncharacterized protein n=1 Tax=Mycena alexandri TaxID=1745969 RepID=A0AAD6SZ72_9AGAR|nr:hypothetical protein C8F04DRAFT_1101856 [Mycena alexandri]